MQFASVKNQHEDVRPAKKECLRFQNTRRFRRLESHSIPVVPQTHIGGLEGQADLYKQLQKAIAWSCGPGGSMLCWTLVQVPSWVTSTSHQARSEHYQAWLCNSETTLPSLRMLSAHRKQAI